MAALALQVEDEYGNWHTINRRDSASELQRMKERWLYSGLFEANTSWRIADLAMPQYPTHPRTIEQAARPITTRQSQVEGNLWKGWRSPGASFRYGAQGRS